MSDAIEDFLRQHGPCLSSTVSEHLVEAYRLSPAAARKRVSRATGEVKRLAYIVFPHKARFVYLQKDFGSPIYWSRLVDALLATNSSYGLAIAAILQRGGIIPSAHFPIACGAPLKQARHLSPTTILARLKEAGLLVQQDIPGLGECITLVQSEGHFDSLVVDVRSRLLTEAVLLTAIREWVRKLGLGSYDRVATRDGKAVPTVASFSWDLTAPSYLGFMVKNGKDGKVKPGFIACDVLLDTLITEAGIRPFINKCVTLRKLRNVGPCMQIFVADKYTTEAFALAKKHGVIPATTRHLFGNEVAEGLRELTIILRRAAYSAIDPDEFDQLFKKLNKIEGAANQIRGTLFEYLAADIARKSISADVRMNRIYKAPDGNKAEADVIAVKNNNAVYFIECKGHSPYATIDDEHVKRWLHYNVPTLFKAAKTHPDWQNLKLHFELWTTGGVSEEAIQLFEKAKSKVRPTKYSLDLKLGQEILDICHSTNDDGLITAFRKHFMKVLDFPDKHVVTSVEYIDGFG